MPEQMARYQSSGQLILAAGFFAAMAVAAFIVAVVTPSPSPSPVVVTATEVVPDERGGVIAELRRMNGETLADNAELDRIIAEQDLLIDDLESELDDARDALANIAEFAPTESPVDVADPPRVVAPPPAPAPVSDHPLVCTNPRGTYVVCETRSGEYRCRSDVTQWCNEWWGWEHQ